MSDKTEADVILEKLRRSREEMEQVAEQLETQKNELLQETDNTAQLPVVGNTGKQDPQSKNSEIVKDMPGLKPIEDLATAITGKLGEFFPRTNNGPPHIDWEKIKELSKDPSFVLYDLAEPDKIRDLSVKSLLEDFLDVRTEPKVKPYGADEAKFSLSHKSPSTSTGKDFSDMKISKDTFQSLVEVSSDERNGEFESCQEICLCNVPRGSVIKTDLDNQLSEIQKKVERIKEDLCNFDDDKDRMRRAAILTEQCKCPHTSQLIEDDVRETVGKVSPVRQLREAYHQLKQNYKGKVEEISKMIMEKNEFFNKFRDLEKQKKESDAEAELAKEKLMQLEGKGRRSQDVRKLLEEKSKEIQTMRKKLSETEEKLRKVEDLSRDQELQLDEYKNKYMEAFQEVEEQKRFVQRVKADNDILREDLNIRIQHIRMQYQKELENLKPYPELLAKTQAELKETLKMRDAADDKYERTLNELNSAEIKIQELSEQINTILLEMKGMEGQCANPKCEETRIENSMLKNNLLVAQNELREIDMELKNKDNEIHELHEHMDTLRKESARQVTELRESADLTKRILQRKILDAETEIAKKEAAMKVAEQDRENLRQRMQNQISFLNESFALSHGKMKDLEWQLRDKFPTQCEDTADDDIPKEVPKMKFVKQIPVQDKPCNADSCPAYQKTSTPF